MRQVAEPEAAVRKRGLDEKNCRVSVFDVWTEQVYPLSMAEARENTRLSNAVVATIRAAARRHGMEAPRVFGSVAAGTSRPDSDLDLLVRLGPGRGYSDLLAFCDELEAELGRRVDVLTEDALNPFLHRRILAGAVAL